MKKIQYLLILVSYLGLTQYGFGQAKKPTLMILPSDNWCEQRFFMTNFDNQGTKQKVPNYKQAFQEDTELGQVISKIGSLMIDRGFPLRASGSSISESPLDKLKNKAKADMIIKIWWKVNTDNSISFVLDAIDSYTNSRKASSSGTSQPSSDIVPVKLEKAILSHIDLFTSQLQAHFDDMLLNGREITLSVKSWENWYKNLETEINDEEIIDHINKWMKLNTVKGQFNMSDATENKIRFEQVRIPLFDKNNQAIDAREFAKGLQKYLKAEPFKFEVKLMTRGLGEAIIVIGEK